jgi:hypothetical protein
MHCTRTFGNSVSDYRGYGGTFEQIKYPTIQLKVCVVAFIFREWHTCSTADIHFPSNLAFTLLKVK